MFYSFSRFLKSPYAANLTASDLDDLRYLTKIFPFKVSNYVLKELIDWSNWKNDPIYRLVFPRKEMLNRENWELLKSIRDLTEEKEIVRKIRRQLNPHPDGQKENIPEIGDRTFGGIQHKYKETVLFFPAQGQTCHSYCTYCFRWAQFVNLDEHKFKSKEHKDLFDYLSANKGVTDILFTGGDPLYMPNETLFSYLDIIMMPELEHIRNIRLGSKAMAFHPSRFLGDEGDDLIEKLDMLKRSGKNVTLMAHFSHPRELSTEKVAKAARRLKSAGVAIRTQAPLIRNINDSPEIWREMWSKQVSMGMIPYYMFIERDTGAHNYFSVPLYRAYDIFTEAYSQVSGLAKTVRGPSMSAHPGKILVDGIADVNGEKKFILKFIQARNPKMINKPFFAKYDEKATWLNELTIEAPLQLSAKGMIDHEDDIEANGVA
ncbi:MAG: KamA family radical SAM protein [Calditrichaceae bacterium]